MTEALALGVTLAGSVTRTGVTVRPPAMLAATVAIPSGVLTILPCPIMDAAWSV